MYVDIYIYMYMFTYKYICIYIYIYIYYHGNNVLSWLSSQWLCSNSCTWAHDVKQTVHQVPKCMSCHKAISVIYGSVHCFNDKMKIYVYMDR